MSIAIVIGTVDRRPGPAYLPGLVRSLRKAGVWTCGLVERDYVWLVEGGSASEDHLDMVQLREGECLRLAHGERGQSANETFAQMARVGVETGAEWVVTLEDDTIVAEDFMPRVAAWADAYATREYPMFPLYCPYQNLIDAKKRGERVYRYPIASFYGTQGCLWRREALASYVAWYEADQASPVQDRPYFWDLLIKDWAQATHPQQKDFLTPVGSFVQHIGRYSALGLHKNFHEAPCVEPLAVDDGIDLTRALVIPGWMHEANLRWFAQQAQTHLRIVEVGAWLGRTTRALADHAPGVVYTVDHWQGTALGDDPVDVGLAQAGAGRVKTDFFINVSDHLDSEKLQLLEMASCEAACHLLASLGPQSFDMLVLDASHDVASVRADLAAWMPLLASGGLACGDDYGFPGVHQAVNEAFATVEVVNNWLWVGKGWRI